MNATEYKAIFSSWDSAMKMLDVSQEMSSEGTVTPFTMMTTPEFPTMSPGFTPKVHQGITIGFITLYVGLFILAYVQLWMIFYYRHKRLSYQSVFLFLCLTWAGLRVTLFSFYFQNVRLANDLPIAAYWLLYCFPVCIQFSLLCLLVLYFAQVLIKARVRYGGPRRHRLWLRIGMLIAVLLFVGTDVTCAVLNKQHQSSVAWYWVIMTRVILCDTMFILAGGALSFCVYKLATMSSANILLEAKGATVTQATAVCVLTILLYLSRAIYDLVAIAIPQKVPGFDYGWVNVSDEADLFNIHLGYGYLSFGLVLFFWEFLPTFVVVVFFRVRRPDIVVTTSTLSSATSVGSYFFNTTRRFSSEEEISRSTGAIAARTAVEDPRLTRSLSASINSPRRPFMYRRFNEEPRNSLVEEDDEHPVPVQTLESAGSVSAARRLDQDD